MPNGKPGDHPLTDALRGDPSGFGPDFDELVRSLWHRPGLDRRQLEAIVNDMASVHAPWSERTPSLARALTRLLALRDQVED